MLPSSEIRRRVVILVAQRSPSAEFGGNGQLHSGTLSGHRRRTEKPKEMSAEKVIKVTRRKTRAEFSAEERFRIVLEGLRGEGLQDRPHTG